jgi:hypothetical protein
MTASRALLDHGTTLMRLTPGSVALGARMDIRRKTAPEDGPAQIGGPRRYLFHPADIRSAVGEGNFDEDAMVARLLHAAAARSAKMAGEVGFPNVNRAMVYKDTEVLRQAAALMQKEGVEA